MLRLAILGFVMTLTPQTSHARTLTVHWGSCLLVQEKIEYIREEQRKRNSARRADLLSKSLREHKKLRRDCEKEGLLY